MIEANQTFEFHFKGASTYQISIKGYIDKNWSERLAGMNVNHYDSENGSFSILTGNIFDRSELFGVLNALNDYQYTILSVNKINL